MTKYLVPLLVLLGLIAISCSSTADEGAGDEADAGSEPSTTSEPSTSTVAPSTTAPRDDVNTDDVNTDVVNADATPVEGQLAWLVAVLDSGTPPTVEELEARLSSTFLAAVPAAAIVDSWPQLFGDAEVPFTVLSTNADGNPDLETLAVLESSNGVRLMIAMQVAPETPHLIEGLQVTPAEIEFPEAVTIDLIDNELSQLAAEHGLGVYDVSDGTCVAVHELDGDRPIPLGSTFKLWILAELAHQVATGDVAWDEPLAIRDEWRSSPDGEVFPQETGTELTLQEHAELMISISDNTATDHLLMRLGRENVEAAMTRIGIAEPEANIPLLSTGELFMLKFLPDLPNAAEYRNLEPVAKRAMLDSLAAEVLPWVASPDDVPTVNADGVDLGDPRDLDIEWFATPQDLCSTLVHLAELAATPGLEPVAEILEINPGAGLPFDESVWPTIRFKGGSEPGVLAGAWWLERADGRRYVVAGGASSPDAALQETDVITLIASATELVTG